MNSYILNLTIIGLAGLTMAWLPTILRKKFLSYPILFVAAGALLYLFPLSLPSPNPLWQEDYVVHLTELVVIISLMGTGLKIRRHFNLKNWQIPLRLISITMLLCIAGLAFMGWGILGLAPAAAVLLGAVLAPTDPVLAEQVQVGPPDDPEEDDVRFSLTAEAGLNDGMAFPFTWLAVVIAIAAGTGSNWLAEWLYRDLVYRIVAGLSIGYVIGWALAQLIFMLPRRFKSFPKPNDGFLALSATLVSYGLTELAHGYGFLAVFVTALTMSSYEEDDEYHTEMHDFVTQVEQIIMVTLLIAFGGSVVTGLLDHLTWTSALIGLAFLFIVRPVTAMIGMIGVRVTLQEKLAISFFGIRGIGSFFYLSFALDKVNMDAANELWSIVGFIVLVSIVLHGVTAARAMSYLDWTKRKAKEPPYYRDEDIDKPAVRDDTTP